jgi:hypothetical protein
MNEHQTMERGVVGEREAKQNRTEQNRAPPGTAGRHLSCDCEHPNPTKPCVSAGGAHTGKRKWAIASLPRPASRTTAPRRTGLPHTHTERKSLSSSSPYHTHHHHHTLPGEMRSKGLVPPLISHRPQRGRSPHA